MVNTAIDTIDAIVSISILMIKIKRMIVMIMIPTILANAKYPQIYNNNFDKRDTNSKVVETITKLPVVNGRRPQSPVYAELSRSAVSLFHNLS